MHISQISYSFTGAKEFRRFLEHIESTSCTGLLNSYGKCEFYKDETRVATTTQHHDGKISLNIYFFPEDRQELSSKIQFNKEIQEYMARLNGSQKLSNTTKNNSIS